MTGIEIALERVHELAEANAALKSKIERLEWENKGIAEWRDEAMRLKGELDTWKRVAELQDSSMLNENARLIAENQTLRLDYLSAETQAGEHFDEVRRLKAELAEARANDRTAMSYLSDVRNTLDFSGDFPALVEYCATLKSQDHVAVVAADFGNQAFAILNTKLPAGTKLFTAPQGKESKC